MFLRSQLNFTIFIRKVTLQHVHITNNMNKINHFYNLIMESKIEKDSNQNNNSHPHAGH